MSQFKEEFKYLCLAVRTSRKQLEHLCNSTLWLRFRELFCTSLGPEWSFGVEQRSPQRKRGCKSWFHMSVWGSTVGEAGKAQATRGQAESESQIGRRHQCQSSIKVKEEKKGGQSLSSDRCWSSRGHSSHWTNLFSISLRGKVWGSKYKSLLEWTPCYWPWLSSGAKPEKIYILHSGTDKEGEN